MLTIFLIVRWRRINRARRAQGALCLNCGFDLAGLDRAGVCPECGVAYDFQANAQRLAATRL